MNKRAENSLKMMILPADPWIIQFICIEFYIVLFLIVRSVHVRASFDKGNIFISIGFFLEPRIIVDDSEQSIPESICNMI